MSLLVDDRELLRRFRAGDEAAMRVVFHHYSRELLRLLRAGFGFSMGGRRVRFRGLTSTFDVEDALQETFRRAFAERARLAYDGLRPYGAYLTTVARNVVIDLYQRNVRRLDRYGFEELDERVELDAADSPVEPWADEAPEPTGAPERDAMADELHALVREYRNELDEREALVFGLRFDEGLTHEQIAAHTGLSPSKIKTAELRIRKGMLRHLHQHGYLDQLSMKAMTAPGGLAEGEAR